MSEQLVWTEEEAAEMKERFQRRFGEPLPRTESLFAVAAVGYRKGLNTRPSPTEIEALRAEVERLRAEVERLSRYYKNGIDCFANPCERHSGERTPPFAEFFEKYGGQCLICVVDNNKALQAENERLALRDQEEGRE